MLKAIQDFSSRKCLIYEGKKIYAEFQHPFSIKRKWDL